MNPALFRDIGSYITAAAGGSGIATAAGAGDATEVDGPYVDRQDHLSASLLITGTAVLGATETLTIAANIQDDADGAGAGVDYGDAYAATIVATGGGGGTTEHFSVQLDFDLAAAKQYVRAQVTPNLSASGTDTCRWSAAWVLGPKQTTPNQ